MSTLGGQGHNTFQQPQAFAASHSYFYPQCSSRRTRYHAPRSTCDQRRNVGYTPALEADWPLTPFYLPLSPFYLESDDASTAWDELLPASLRREFLDIPHSIPSLDAVAPTVDLQVEKEQQKLNDFRRRPPRTHVEVYSIDLQSTIGTPYYVSLIVHYVAFPEDESSRTALDWRASSRTNHQPYERPSYPRNKTPAIPAIRQPQTLLPSNIAKAWTRARIQHHVKHQYLHRLHRSLLVSRRRPIPTTQRRLLSLYA
ncbi:hypothetical protein BKA70DRAFT_1249342 [Coprinopsis sp. MPI-PUGE-AT-0042]|nr:hypothetical protein BKA70DRAFT_1249342 [Coprinopsis sp. MPI-PUGE-AT-0042]